MPHYDLVLVLDYFRSAAGYLSIIKYLAARYAIGLYVTPGDGSLLEKNRDAHRLFIDECIRLGARVLGPEAVDADLLIVQQRPYPDEVVDQVKRTIRAKRRIGYLSLATVGVLTNDAFVGQFELQKVYVPNLRLFRFLLGRRRAQPHYAGTEVEQVGLPFAQYPVYPEFVTDYLVAAPTLFSFKSERQKQAFLENVISLFGQMAPDDTVVYKPHNGAFWDYFAPRGYLAAARLGGWSVGPLRALLGDGAEWMQRLYTADLHLRLQRRAQPMGSVTPYSSFALEAFLPGVRKGVIGGLSNTIWGTLYFDKVFYNCVDEEERAASTQDELLPHKDGRHLLDVNLEFFGVPNCGASLSRGVRGETIILPEDRRGDLIRTVETDIERARA